MVGFFSTLATCALIANALARPQSDVGVSSMGDPVGQAMGFSISFWDSSNCHEKAKSVQEVLFNSTIEAVTGHTPIASYKISRDMMFEEVLEFSNSYGDIACGKKLEITSPDSNGHPLVQNKCYTFSDKHTAKCFTYYQPGDHGTTPEPNSAPVPQLLKRYEDTGLHLDTWEQLNCPGKPTASAELLVGANTTLTQSFVAYKLSRSLGSTDQLDFSGADPSITTTQGVTPDYCAKFVEKTNPMKSPEYGFSVLQKGRCYSLTGGVLAHCAHYHN